MFWNFSQWIRASVQLCSVVATHPLHAFSIYLRSSGAGNQDAVTIVELCISFQMSFQRPLLVQELGSSPLINSLPAAIEWARCVDGPHRTASGSVFSSAARV